MSNSTLPNDIADLETLEEAEELGKSSLRNQYVLVLSKTKDEGGKTKKSAKHFSYIKK